MNKVIIIAEAGVNHNGDMSIAKKLIDAAVDAEVDYVKFQSFKASNLVSPYAKKAEYQIKNTSNDDTSQLGMLKKLELSHDDHIELMSYCKQKKINFLSTAFDTQGVKYLDKLGLDLFKIPSGEITNFPYLREIALTGKPIILSTGMSTINDISNALDVFKKYGLNRKEIVVLHCNTEYPTPMNDVNLKAMLTIGNTFNVHVGYSDHTLGIEVPIAAVAMGATVIEKHFTLDKTLSGPDHAASLEPAELKEMVKSIRNIEATISGDGLKKPSESEMKNIVIARKSIHLSKDLPAGSIISEKDIIPLRPGDGICSMNWEDIIGKRLNKNLKKYSKLKLSDFL